MGDILRINVSVSDGDRVVWRTSRQIKEKARYRLGLEEYDLIAVAAEKELYNQIRIDAKKNQAKPEENKTTTPKSDEDEADAPPATTPQTQ